MQSILRSADERESESFFIEKLYNFSKMLWTFHDFLKLFHMIGDEDNFVSRILVGSCCLRNWSEDSLYGFPIPMFGFKVRKMVHLCVEKNWKRDEMNQMWVFLNDSFNSYKSFLASQSCNRDGTLHCISSTTQLDQWSGVAIKNIQDTTSAGLFQMQHILQAMHQWNSLGYLASQIHWWLQKKKTDFSPKLIKSNLGKIFVYLK